LQQLCVPDVERIAVSLAIETMNLAAWFNRNGEPSICDKKSPPIGGLEVNQSEQGIQHHP